MEENKEIIEIIRGKFGSDIVESETDGDMPSVTVTSGSVYSIISFLKNDASAGYEFLTDLCGIHYPDNKLPLGVIYHLHNLRNNMRLRIKTFVPVECPEVDSLTPLFSAANWMERETFDFYGIRFRWHPNLKRILNVEYLDIFPMRKEYPLEDPTREDKDNRFFGR